MADLEVLPTAGASDALLVDVRALLAAAFDGAFSDDDWDHALGGWHAVVREHGRLVAHAAVVPRTVQIGDRPFQAGYVEAVATHPAAQGAGHGSLAMTGVMEIIGRAFEIGVLSTGRAGFYRRLGWERWQGPTFVIRDEAYHRTADEDDGIMVLRVGVSTEVALTEQIACHARTGDDW